MVAMTLVPPRRCSFSAAGSLFFSPDEMTKSIRAVWGWATPGDLTLLSASRVESVGRLTVWGGDLHAIRCVDGTCIVLYPVSSGVSLVAGRSYYEGTDQVFVLIACSVLAVCAGMA